jgi:Holliday junction resolvase
MEETYMAMTPEAKVKKKVVAHLKTLGAYYFYPVTGGYGKSGVPDIIGCYDGKFFGIECKAGSNKPTALQEKNLSDIKKSGGISLVINEDNIDDVLIYVGGLNRDPRQLELDFEGSPV